MVYIALAVAAGLIGLDQLTKILIDTNMQVHDSISVLNIGGADILKITYERNTGAAFSMFSGNQGMLAVFTLIIIVAMLVYLLMGKVKRKPYIWCMALIIAGGIGNLIDRILRDFVIDFIDVRIINFAIFNVADICAVLGAFGLMLFIIIDEVKAAKEKKAKKLAQAQSNTDEEKKDTP